MSNLYHDSEEAIAGLRKGTIPKRSIVKVQWPSGAIEHVRFHRWDKNRNVMIGCNMGWDNLATESYDLSQAVVGIVVTEREDKQDGKD